MAAGALIALAAFFALGEVPTGEHWAAATFFTLFGFLATALAYPTARGTSGNISFLPFLSIAILAPNAAAIVCVVVSMLLGETAQRRPALKLVFNTAQQTFTVALAIAAYRAAGGESLLVGSAGWGAFVALVATYFTINKLAVSTVITASSGGSTYQHWMSSMKGSVLYDTLSLPVVVLLAWLYAEQGMIWTALAALPMLGIRQLYRAVFALEKVNEELLQLMVASIEARDPYTSGHSQRVARYAREIAKGMGVPARQIDRIEIAALLHDVGKIHEEFAQILRKPGRLSVVEFEVMKLHPVRSAELVAKVTHFADLVAAVRAHHETWDGSGYPDQLVGNDIPLAARIIALADTIDAMTTSRPYRAGMALAEVRHEIEKECGRQFDPRIASTITAPHVWAQLSQVVLRAQVEYPALDASSTASELPVGRTGEFELITSR